MRLRGADLLTLDSVPESEEPEAAEPASVSTIKLSATALGEQLDRPRGSCEGVDEPLPSSKPESGNFWRNMTKSFRPPAYFWRIVN